MLVKEIDLFKDIWAPYPHQKEFLRAFFSGEYSSFAERLHRRAGKDSQTFNAVWIYAAMVAGNYLYTLPKIAQARNVVWEGTDLDGRRWIDMIPKHLIKSLNQSQCKIYFTNGSILHITGADALMQSHLGSNLRGIVLSEYHKTSPAIYDYLRPILKRSKGWIVFLFTAYAKGHAHRLMQANLDNPGWWCRTLTVADTRDNQGNFIFSPEQIEEERRSGMPEAIIQQEYYCSEEATLMGTFFSEEISKARAEGRIVTGMKAYSKFPVYTSWDLGSRDTNAIWFFQVIDKKFYYFYFHEKNYGSIDYYISLLADVAKRYGFVNYGGHFMPHDVSQTEWTTGKSRIQTLRERGIKVVQVPRMKVIERVQVARTQFKHCIIDEEGCKNGLEALTIARSGYDANTRSFTSDEVHDWSSHPSAAFQYGHVGWLDSFNNPQLQQIKSYTRTI